MSAGFVDLRRDACTVGASNNAVWKAFLWELGQGNLAEAFGSLCMASCSALLVYVLINVVQASDGK